MKKNLLIIFCSLVSTIFNIFIFKSILLSKTVIFKFAIHPFNICEKYLTLWNIIKILFVFNSFFSYFILYKKVLKIYYTIFYSKKTQKNQHTKQTINNNPTNLHLNIGYDSKNNLISLPEKSLYQNILITGTIGSGKTSSAMYPFTEQLIKYKCNNIHDKIGMLILDVKGNYYSQVLKYAKKYNRETDLIKIDLSGKIKYNPLDKSNLHPSILADRLKNILLLFSPNNSEDFWLDKVSYLICESIKLCRLYNNNYVTFVELHNLIFYRNYYLEKVNELKKNFLNNKLSSDQIYTLLSCLNFFENEFYNLDDRTISIIKSEVSRITGLFISDYTIKHVFCPQKNEINFLGFKDVINSGKIVILNMNIAEYRNLSKLIATYLKLDFQNEVIARIPSLNKLSIKNNYSNRPVCFICDEYQEYVNLSDSNFYAQSREAKCINIVSTQSYTSLLNTLNNQNNVKVIIQNLVNKLWLRTDDTFTIEEAQKIIGKDDKKKISKSISENAKETNYNYLLNSFLSKCSNISESINSYYQQEYIFDTKFFSRNLETFSCMSFLSNGDKILKPQKLKLIPYFKIKQ